MPSYDKPVEMVLNRNAALNSTVVGRIVFTKGIPVRVPPRGIEEALSIGAVFVDGSSYEPEESDLPDVPSDVQVRMKKISDVIPSIAKRNRPADFTGAGTPRVDIFKELIGFTPDSREIHAAWREYTAQQAEMKAEERIAERAEMEAEAAEEPAPKKRGRPRKKAVESDE